MCMKKKAFIYLWLRGSKVTKPSKETKSPPKKIFGLLVNRFSIKIRDQSTLAETRNKRLGAGVKSIPIFFRSQFWLT